VVVAMLGTGVGFEPLPEWRFHPLTLFFYFPERLHFNVFSVKNLNNQETTGK
jgi:hypothetical protein